MVGFVAFFILTIYISLSDVSKNADELPEENVSKLPIIAFMITALCCLAFSTACHWLWSKNEQLCTTLTVLDYQGIILLILGTNYPFVTYRFACGYLIFYRHLFNSVLSICGIACMIVVLKPTFLTGTPKLILFIVFVLMVLVPSVVLYTLDDHENSIAQDTLTPIALCILPYLTGLLFYAVSFPERCSNQGRFDIIGQSHHVHHICVLLGIGFALAESLQIYRLRLEFSCPAEN